MVSKMILVYISNLSKVVKLDDSDFAKFCGLLRMYELYPVDIICLHNRGVEKAVINNHSFCNKIIASDSTNV